MTSEDRLMAEKMLAALWGGSDYALQQAESVVAGDNDEVLIGDWQIEDFIAAARRLVMAELAAKVVPDEAALVRAFEDNLLLRPRTISRQVSVAFLGTICPILSAFQARVEVADEENKRLRGIIERDRSMVALHLEAIKRAIAGRRWLSEPGRGSFDYDDEQYQKEFGIALLEIEKPVDELKRIAADLSDSPMAWADIVEARTALEQPHD